MFKSIFLICLILSFFFLPSPFSLLPSFVTHAFAFDKIRSSGSKILGDSEYKDKWKGISRDVKIRTGFMTIGVVGAITSVLFFLEAEEKYDLFKKSIYDDEHERYKSEARIRSKISSGLGIVSLITLGMAACMFIPHDYEKFDDEGEGIEFIIQSDDDWVLFKAGVSF